MDEFAQTRQPDGLFDDDFTPIVIEPLSNKASLPSHQPPHGHTRAHLPAPRPSIKASDIEAISPTADLTPKPPPAVRGDRSATGGINKPKLTDTELSARLEQAKRNNARREEAHRLAKADEDSFQELEAQASEKRKQEGLARRVMDGEREKNRLRKLGAQAGREWDEGKEHQTVGLPMESQYRRGVHGGVFFRGGRHQDGNGEHAPRYPQGHEGSGRPNFAPRGGRGRGDRTRGERGRGGRGGRGRGSGLEEGNGSKGPSNPIAPPNIGVEKDFPTLPPSKTPPMSRTPHAITLPFPLKPAPTSKTAPVSKNGPPSRPPPIRTPKTLFGSKSYPSSIGSSRSGPHQPRSSNGGSSKPGTPNAGTPNAGTPRIGTPQAGSSRNGPSGNHPTQRFPPNGLSRTPKTHSTSSSASNGKPIGPKTTDKPARGAKSTTAAPSAAPRPPPANPRSGLNGAFSPVREKQSWADQVEDKERRNGK